MGKRITVLATKGAMYPTKLAAVLDKHSGTEKVELWEYEPKVLNALADAPEAVTKLLKGKYDCIIYIGAETNAYAFRDNINKLQAVSVDYLLSGGRLIFVSPKQVSPSQVDEALDRWAAGRGNYLFRYKDLPEMQQPKNPTDPRKRISPGFIEIIKAVGL
jgi:hypothetical protein